MKTGPNVASGIIWACGKFFFFFFLLVFLILANVFKFLNTNYATGRAAMTKNGPNDARRVVWTLCEYFFSFSSFF